MKVRLDMKKIARGLGAVRQGRLRASGGYFGAMQLLGDIEERFRVPSHGGRATDPRWTERRLVPLARGPGHLLHQAGMPGRLTPEFERERRHSPGEVTI